MMDRRTFLHASLATVAASSVARAADSAGKELPFRQIHLDYHTSELIPDVGADFDAKEFLATLRAARVNSINVFAKCHHGYAYYNTQIATKHPALQKDLLGEMVSTLRPAGIKVNYYYSLVWDVLQSRRHPEWLMKTKDGQPVPISPIWPSLCMNSPYLDHVVRENEEIVANYDTDGGWWDILKQPADGCYCEWCRADRQKLGLSDSPTDIFKHNKLVAKRTEERLNDVVHKRDPKAITFFNSRLVIGVRDELPYYTHIEIESLPTGGWGYSHFQQRVRYMRTLGKDLVGMTGRFHKSWGDFGGLKNQAALDFECLNFMANGAKVCIGDQLHPRGRLDATTYQRVGKSFAKVEALEPWARGAKALADIGVLSTAPFDYGQSTQKIGPVDQGFTNMLVELHQQFNILDAESDFTAYRVVIVPDQIPALPALVSKLQAYIKQGGALLVSGESLLDPATKRFLLPELGVRYVGPAKYAGEYLLLRGTAFPAIDLQPYFLYQPGLSIAAEPGTDVLATYGHPYFDRSKEQFSSHKQTPLGQRTEEPVITRRGNVVYIANLFFRSYSQDAYGVQKQVVGELLKTLLPKPVVQADNLPSTAQMTVLQQPQQGGRMVVHLLHYPLTRRAPDIDVIEEPGLLEEVTLRVRMAQKPSQVELVPERKAVAFQYADGYATCRLPRVLGHQAIAFS